MSALELKSVMPAEDDEDGDTAKNVEGGNISPGPRPQVLNRPAE